LEALADAGAQVNDALHPVGGQEGVAEYVFCLLADAVDAAGPLDEPDDGPRQVKVHDNVGVLKVLALAQHICGNQHPQFIRPFDRIALAVALRAEAPGKAGGVLVFARDAGDVQQTTSV
jgi:hypothetical protein